MIKIEIDDREVRAALAELAARVGDLTPVMQEIGEVLVESSKQRFAKSQAPDGSPWAPNRPVTLARKSGSRPLIGETKSLSEQIHARAGRDRVEIGSTMQYAATQQFGARRGQFGKTRRGAPIPWGDIPARPFLGLSADDRDAVLEIVAEQIGSALK